MKNKLCSFLLAVAMVLVLVAGALWHRSNSAIEESRTRVVQALLQSAVALLDENQVLLKEGQAGQPVDKGGDVLEAYLAKIRRDGVPAHSQSRQRLDRIAHNNVAIVTLMTAYGPYARTPALQREMDRFREHVASWQGRWVTVMEVFMVGGTYATAPIAFPPDLPEKLRDELAAAR